LFSLGPGGGGGRPEPRRPRGAFRCGGQRGGRATAGPRIRQIGFRPRVPRLGGRWERCRGQRGETVDAHRPPQGRGPQFPAADWCEYGGRGGGTIPQTPKGRGSGGAHTARPPEKTIGANPGGGSGGGDRLGGAVPTVANPVQGAVERTSGNKRHKDPPRGHTMGRGPKKPRGRAKAQKAQSRGRPAPATPRCTQKKGRGEGLAGGGILCRKFRFRRRASRLPPVSFGRSGGKNMGPPVLNRPKRARTRPHLRGLSRGASFGPGGAGQPTRCVLPPKPIGCLGPAARDGGRNGLAGGQEPEESGAYGRVCLFRGAKGGRGSQGGVGPKNQGSGPADGDWGGRFGRGTMVFRGPWGADAL